VPSNVRTEAMKTCFFLLAISFCSLPNYSQISSEVNRELDRIIRATGIQDAILQTHRDVRSTIHAKFVEAPPSFLQRVDEQSAAAVIDGAKSVFLKYFTLEELQALAAFYESPLGKKMAATMPQILHECSVIEADWAKTVINDATRELKALPSKPAISAVPGPGSAWSPYDELTANSKPQEWREKARYRIDVAGRPRYYSEREPTKSGGMLKFFDLRAGKETQVSPEGVAIVKLK
jgi:uncharacterized protein